MSLTLGHSLFALSLFLNVLERVEKLGTEFSFWNYQRVNEVGKMSSNIQLYTFNAL